MQPLSTFTPGRVEGLVFDIDDTVTEEGILVPAAYQAMHALADAGIALVAVTGRPLGWSDVVARQWPVSVAIGENGAGWAWVDGHGFHEGYFADEDERHAHEAVLARIRATVRERMPHVREARDQRARRCDLAFDIGEEESLADADIMQLVSLIEQGGAASAVSSVHAHAIPGRWNKALGVQTALRNVRGIDLGPLGEGWVFVGDSGNDEAAFAFFEWSVGVANVAEHLSRMDATPKYVTTRPRGDGFSELARRILDLRATHSVTR